MGLPSSNMPRVGLFPVCGPSLSEYSSQRLADRNAEGSQAHVNTAYACKADPSTMTSQGRGGGGHGVYGIQ